MTHTYRYDFNAKEHQPELGLNWHDYHARNYDAALGRWMNVDPLGEKYTSWSPYNYVMNSPLRFTDPTGMFIEPPTKPGEIEGDVHFDEDTGASYEWDGEGGWHSDLQGGEELDEVYITNESFSEDNTNSDLNDVGWFLSSNLSAVERNSTYYSKHYTAKYGTRNLSSSDVTRQTRAQMGRYARNARIGGGIVTIGFGGYDVYSGWKQDGEQFGYNSHLAIGRVVGGIGGAWLGAQAGGTIGLLTVNPYVPVITAIGGAFVGGYYGSMVGESFVEWLYKE